MKSLKKHPLITGTIVLTVTGLVSRLIGFFYRIYLSRLFGEEGMGIYQLIGPITSLSFALAAAGYQTAISKLVAESAAKEGRASYKPLLAGLSISLPLSLACNAAVYRFSDLIASRFLMEPRTAPMLRIIAFTIPLSAVHACINGYFYGIKKTGIPAATQLLEQCLRVGCVFFLSSYALSRGAALTINVAVLGLVVGELGSTALSILSIYKALWNSVWAGEALWRWPGFLHTGNAMHTEHSIRTGSNVPLESTIRFGSNVRSNDAAHSSTHAYSRNVAQTGDAVRFRSAAYLRNAARTGNASRSRGAARSGNTFRPGSAAQAGNAAVYRPLLAMALPLTANRIVLNLLQSLEAVSIPDRLRLYGYDTSAALSVYGVLTGMAMPLIFFPNALTSAVSVLLLPMISESYAKGDMKAVKRNTVLTVKYCGLLGTLCLGGFLLCGGWIGETLFHSALAGHFIRTLSFLCPFLYLDTTLSSILQGLGMAGRIFLMNVFSLLLRLGFVFLAVPVFGIKGYLWGILASQISLSLLYLLCLFSLRKSKSWKSKFRKSKGAART